MECVDWNCGKNTCILYNKIINTLSNTMCYTCADEQKQRLCKTCKYGVIINSQTARSTYLCRKDNTVGFQIED